MPKKGANKDEERMDTDLKRGEIAAKERKDRKRAKIPSAGRRRRATGTVAVPGSDGGAVGLRDYQKAIFKDHRSGIVVLHWARQIGKSYTLAAWAVFRLLRRPGRLVTVLSNSRENGAEFVSKCAEICRLNGTRIESIVRGPSLDFEDMRMEVRIRAKGRTGRIKVLAANPRTARGFSGDLILDEFAFHEDSNAIWAAAEPILASNPDFLCRIASTGNGRHNMFFRIAATGGLATDETRIKHRPSRAWNQDGEGESSPQSHGDTEGESELAAKERKEHREEEGIQGSESRTGRNKHKSRMQNTGSGTAMSRKKRKEKERHERCAGMFVNGEGFRVSRITRTMAHGQGVAIYDAQSRLPITPEAARAQALDKAAYDQNYECAFADENLTLLSHELISAAEREDVGFICEQDWLPAAVAIMKEATGNLYVGFDVGRKVDLSVITVIEKVAGLHLVRGILRIQDMRLPEQELRLGEICRLPRFHRAAIDMTGLGLGLFEYAQKAFGSSRIHGINFASTVPATKAILEEGRRRETVRVTEALAVELLRAYEDRRMQHPRDGRLRDDLRKPEKVTSPGGRVSIAATRDEAGHADHFWSLALAVEACGKCAPFAFQTIPRGVLRRDLFI
jgi:phage FluMu gp28-like protein